MKRRKQITPAGGSTPRAESGADHLWERKDRRYHRQVRQQAGSVGRDDQTGAPEMRPALRSHDPPAQTKQPASASPRTTLQMAQALRTPQKLTTYPERTAARSPKNVPAVKKIGNAHGLLGFAEKALAENYVHRIRASSTTRRFRTTMHSFPPGTRSRPSRKRNRKFIR